jgi:hypothetical protein
MIEKPKRDIEVITGELQTALKREATDVIAIGDLLLEAKEQLKHGKWLPWLKSNFGSSDSTAQNYMNAARLAIKYPTVGNLKLKPTALYFLGLNLVSTPSDEIKAIFKVAKTEWIDQERACEIIESIHARRRGTEPRAEVEEQQCAVDEAEAILDGPPPELPPPEEGTPVDPNLQLFDATVEALAKLYTKPIATFATTKHDPKRLRDIAGFLEMVGKAVEQRKTGIVSEPPTKDESSR